MTLNEQIVQEAKDWLGVPYQHRSWTKNGCDCTGLILGVIKGVGFIQKYEVRRYPKDWNLHAMADDFLVQELSKFATLVPKSETLPGDILVFKFGHCESHMGIKMEHDLFLHIMDKSITKLAKLRNSPFNKRWGCSFRFDETKLRGVL